LQEFLMLNFLTAPKVKLKTVHYLLSALTLDGVAQRDLPVHVINEYCRTDQSFDPLPKFEFKEDTLPRETKYSDYTTHETVALFPLLVSDFSGLGVDFALVRGARVSWLGACVERGIGYVRRIDLAAVSRLDVVRTNELKLSREFLAKPAEPEHGLGPR
jgi:hypothetical protein